MMATHSKIGWKTALGLVLSNMIGTGVFTSLGYQLVTIHSTWTILILWLLGGVLALIGAFTYAELGTHYGQRGGDFVFISEGFHPFLGYLSAWTSLIVGFSAPIAISAIAMEDYLAPLHLPWQRGLTIILILSLCWIHSGTIQGIKWFQDFATIFKMLFLVALLAIGLSFAPVNTTALQWTGNVSNEVFSSGFAVSLVYVFYAYSGWNAAAYIVDEIAEPNRHLPRALIGGVAIVTAVYVSLQLVFLKFASFTDLSGKTEVALIATRNILGTTTGQWVSIGIALQLIASMSSLLWIGSRIVHSMSMRYEIWSFLRPTNRQNVPVRAVWTIGVIVLILMSSGKLQQIMVYTSFLLQLMSTISVASLLMTKRLPTDFRSPFRPYLQWAFIAFNLAILGFIFNAKPLESLVGLGILAIGIVTYLGDKWHTRYKSK
jgi:amino acid transporter